MTGNLPAILVASLSVVAMLCVLGMIGDLRRGTSRLAHEWDDAARAQVPLNYWMGVGSKALGAVVAIVLAAWIWLTRA